MHNIAWRLLSSLGILAVLGPLQVCAQYKPVNVKWFVDWKSEDGRFQARALDLLETSDINYSNLTLLETPQRRRLVLRHTLFGPEGLTITRIQDDATGWWLELRHDVRLRFKDLHDYFKNSYERLTGKAGAQTQYTFVTSRGFKHEVVVAVEEMERFRDFGALEQRLREAGAGPKLTAALPAAALDALRFLASVDSNKNGPGEALQYADLAELMLWFTGPNAQRPAASPYDDVQWETLKEGERGTTELAGAFRAFAQNFHSISPEDPLAGYHVNQLRAQPPQQY
jgi:hypothetical protein